MIARTFAFPEGHENIESDVVLKPGCVCMSFAYESNVLLIEHLDNYLSWHPSFVYFSKAASRVQEYSHVLQPMTRNPMLVWLRFILFLLRNVGNAKINEIKI